MPTHKMDLDTMQTNAIEQLRWLNQEGGLTVTEIGERLRAPRGTVSRWINGHKKPIAMACALIERVYEDRRRERGLEQTS